MNESRESLWPEQEVFLLKHVTSFGKQSGLLCFHLCHFYACAHCYLNPCVDTLCMMGYLEFASALA